MIVLSLNHNLNVGSHFALSTRAIAAYLRVELHRGVLLRLHPTWLFPVVVIVGLRSWRFTSRVVEIRRKVLVRLLVFTSRLEYIFKAPEHGLSGLGATCIPGKATVRQFYWHAEKERSAVEGGRFAPNSALQTFCDQL